MNGTDISSYITESFNEYWLAFVSALPALITGTVVFIIFLLLAMLVGRLVRRRLKPNAEDPLLLMFISKLARSIITILGLILFIRIIGFQGVAGSLLAGAGIGAFIIGFAFKDIGENFLSGFILAFKRPFRINDTIEINGIKGNVKQLNLRDTHIKSFDGNDIFIPNSFIIKQPLINYTLDGHSRFEFVVGVDYDDDLDVIEQEIQNILAGIEGLVAEKPPIVAVDELATSTVNIKVYFWIYTFDYRRGALAIKSEVIKKVKNMLLQKGFVLPANIQEIKLYGRDKGFPIKIMEGTEGILPHGEQKQP